MSRSFMAIDPRLGSAIEWADQTSLTLYDLTAVPRLTREEDWRGWARELCDDPVIAAFNPPSPDAHENWRDWAAYFNESILSRSGA